MKLTPAEYKLLDGAINSANMHYENGYRVTFERDLPRKLVRCALEKGLIAKRAWSKGYVVATALGKRSHARGKS